MSKRYAVPVFAFLFLAFTVTAFGQCATPSTVGVLKICYPSNGSSIIGGTTFEMAANTGSASIDKVVIYDNGKHIDDLGFLPGTLVEGAIHDGYHKVTVKAWDTNGREYVAYDTFTKVGGFDPGVCSASTTGATLCSPKSGAIEPNVSVPVSFALNTTATPKAWKLYLDGAAVMVSTPDTLKRAVTSLSTRAGSHKVTVAAWDTAGTVYKTSHTFTSFYMYDCNPSTGDCTPGIQAIAPEGFGPYSAVDTDQSFSFHAETVKNPSPIQKMSVTLDGVVIAQNSGPGITVTINAKPGSHVVNVQAMDTAGKLYATYGTINVH